MSELEIFSDFNCTWCYFDKPSIDRLEREYDITIRWRAFPLHPDIPEGGMPIEELFGYQFPLMNDKMKQLELKAESLGLPLTKRTSISDSRLSQELAKWAEGRNKLREYQKAVYKAYFSDGSDISEFSVLLGIANTCGLPEEEARTVIEERTFSHAVDRDWEKSEELGIMVAPTYMMNGTRLTGSQSYERLEKLMADNHISKKRHSQETVMKKMNGSVQKFNEGYSCSQAIFTEYGVPEGLDLNVALKISSGFGGGMCRGETCGAVTGAFMVLGMMVCGDDGNKTEGRKQIYDAVSQFTQAFERIHGSVRCKTLLGCDMGTPEGVKTARDGNLFKTLCPKFVETAATILESMMENRTSGSHTGLKGNEHGTP